jgi:photosystem II stability/assembly factor-like uncharacterized protein
MVGCLEEGAMGKIAVGFFLSIGLYANGWKQVHPSFSTPGFYNMYAGTFIDDKNGWYIECFPGRIWHTADGGKYWNKQKDSTAVWAYDMAFLNVRKGFVVGRIIPDYQHFIWKTENGGATWLENTSIFTTYKLFFIDSLIGYAASDNQIYKTIDGGTAWHKTSIDSGISFSILNIHFPDKRHGWAVGGNNMATETGIILNTLDGGETWQINVEEAADLGFGVFFTDSLHGVVVGHGAMMRTENGGQTWEYKYGQCSQLNDVIFTDDTTGWAIANYGFICKTRDRGKNWNQIESGTTNDLNRIVFVENGMTGFIFGDKNTLLRYDALQNEVDDKAISLSPKKIELYQNYPNPFNGETNIVYNLMSGSMVLVKILDLAGRHVVTLVDGFQSSGRHILKWSGRDKENKPVSCGIYLLHLNSSVGDEEKTIKLLMTK